MSSALQAETTELYQQLSKLSEEDLYVFLQKAGGDQKARFKSDLIQINERVYNWENRIEKDIELRAKCYYASLVLFTFSEIKKLNWMAYGNIKNDMAMTIFKDLKPDWLAEYFDHIISENFRFYDYIRKYYVEGLIPKPSNPNYIIGLISLPERLRFRDKDNTDNLYNFLSENADALEDFWKVFEVEGVAEANMSSIEKYEGKPFWDQTILKLITSKMIDRKEVLDKTFEPLRREWIQFRSGWFRRFHEYLEPTVEERKEHEQQYLQLLSNSIPTNKSFAIKALTILSKNDLLDENAFVSSCEHVLISDKKSLLNSTIKILKRISDKDPSFNGAISEKIVQALFLQDASIQKEVFKVLEKTVENKIDFQPKLTPYIDLIVPSVKTEFKSWHTQESPKIELTNRDHSLPLKSFQKVKAITDENELLFHISQVLESGNQICEIEKIYQAAFNFNELSRSALDPIKGRAEYWYKRIDGFNFTKGYLVNFLLSWKNNFKYDIDYDVRYDSFARLGINEFQQGRIQELVKLKRKKVNYAMLSVPSIEPYFIEPDVFVERLITNQAFGTSVGEYDLILAVARLKLSEGINKEYSSLNGELKDLCDFIFKQGDYRPKDYKYAWICAFRTVHSDQKLDANLDLASVSDVVHPMDIKWGLQLDDGPYRHDKISIDFLLPKSEEVTKNNILSSLNELINKKEKKVVRYSSKLIYPLLTESAIDGYFFEYNQELDIKWMLSATPNKQDMSFALAAKWIGGCASYSSVSDMAAKFYLEDLCYSDTQMKEMKLLTIAVGLGCSEKSVKAMSTEALIIGLLERRISVGHLSSILDKLIGSGYMRMNRLVQCLNEVSKATDQLSKTLCLIIVDSLKSTSPDRIPKYFKNYLQLLLECKILTDMNFTDPQWENLKKFEGVGNLKQVVKQIFNS